MTLYKFDRRSLYQKLISLCALAACLSFTSQALAENGIKKACIAPLLFIASPDAPVVVPEKPITRPDFDPEHAPQPPVTTPRRAPNPLPDRPLSPTFDPKDIIPVDLYEHDGEMKNFWANLPHQVREIFIQESNDNFSQLSDDFQKQYGVKPDLRQIAINIARASQALEPLERKHKSDLEKQVRVISEDRFGTAATKVLKTSISDQMPSRTPRANDQEPSHLIPGQHSIAPDIDHGLMDFFSRRREFYNLLAQAEGWSGMREFIAKGKPKFDSIDKNLAGLYAELDLNWRLAIQMQLKHVPNVQMLQGDEMREQITNGREIVCVNCKQVKDDLGRYQIEIANITGVAVGRNGWALAHEAFKAAFQIETALEATQRAPLNSRERQILDDRSNSNVAEIRQGIYGEVLRSHMQKFISQLINSQSTHSYFVIVERVFSLLPSKTFESFIYDALTFDSNKMNIESFRKKYNEILLLDEFREQM